MSTPTPRTSEAAFTVYSAEDRKIYVTLASFSEGLETELTAANARIAELETLAGDRLIAFTKYKYESESLTRQLSESQAQLASLREANAVLQSQVDNADINLEQVRMTQKGLWRTKVESAESRIKELEAQLASAREDGARLDYLFEKPSRMPMSDGRGGWLVAEYIGHVIGRGDTPRSAIDSARGVTSPPAVAETGEKDALEASPETEGFEPFTPINPPRFGTLTTSWGEECTVKVYGSLDDGKVALFNYTTEGRLVTGAMAQMDSIEFDSPLPPPPQGKEKNL